MIIRYIYGWYMWIRVLKMTRRKKHGAGAQKWDHALKSAACARYIVDGQFRGSKGPRYLRGLQ